MLSMGWCTSLCLCFLLGRFAILSVDGGWPVSNSSKVQLLGIFSNEFNSTTLSWDSLQARAMFISAILLSQQYNVTVNGQHLGWQSIGSGGNVMNALSSACQLTSSSNIVGMVGPSVSREAYVLAPFAAKLRIPLISFASTDPELSDRKTYPTFYRTVPSDNAAALAMAMFFLKFNWTSTIIIYQNDVFGSNGAKAISETFTKNNVAVAEMIVFDIVTHAIRGDLTSLLTSSTTRMVIVWAQSAYALLILQEALDADVLGPQFTWILSASVPLDTFERKWNDKLVGIFSIEPVVGSVVDAQFNSTLLTEAYRIWQTNEPETFPGSNRVDYYALFAFDAAWTLIQSLQDLCSSNASCVSFLDAPLCFDHQLLHSEELFNRIDNTTFLGVSGTVQFRSNVTDRTSGAYYVLKNIQDPFTGLTHVPVAVWAESTAWSPHTPSNVIVWPGKSFVPPTGYADIAGVKLRIAVVETSPFTMIKEIEGEDGRITRKIVGYVPDLIQHLQEKLHFIPEVVFLAQKNITYNGLIDAVANKTYDLIIADVTVGADRREKVGFTSAIYDNSLRVITRTSPSIDVDWLFYIRPFSFELRLVILSVVILAGLLIFLFEGHRHPAIRRKHAISRLPMCWWYTTGTMAGYSADFHVGTAAGRMITLGLYITCFVLTAVYQANLTSNLTLFKAQGPITGIDDIKNGKVAPGRIGILVGTSIESYYLREISVNSRNFYRLYSKEEMFDKLLTNSIDVSIMDSGVLDYFTNGVYCNLTLVGAPFDHSAFGIVFQKKWIYEQVFDVSLLSLRESGKLDELRTRWFQAKECSRPTQNIAETTLESTAGLFITFGVVCVLAIPLFLWFNRSFAINGCRRARKRRHSSPPPAPQLPPNQPHVVPIEPHVAPIEPHIALNQLHNASDLVRRLSVGQSYITADGDIRTAL